MTTLRHKGCPTCVAAARRIGNQTMVDYMFRPTVGSSPVGHNDSLGVPFKLIISHVDH